MKWWQKKVRGWTVPFWYTDTPLYSKRVAMLTDKELNELRNEVLNKPVSGYGITYGMAGGYFSKAEGKSVEIKKGDELRNEVLNK